jgi:ADP-ribose pyrophosphatase YjhB (NUDIX family)
MTLQFDKNLRPAVGLGTMIFKDGKVLLGKRKSKLGEGYFAWPGGNTR